MKKLGYEFRFVQLVKLRVSCFFSLSWNVEKLLKKNFLSFLTIACGLVGWLWFFYCLFPFYYQNYAPLLT